ncbi:hypothetical protein M8C21_029588 [Ambrosia artemisiifolia]|uniref:Mannan endo-1,4-beta-mannosidase n=1 Tax=Ambrosia artemisiifolia TaxID=4212 RepID=A0AAD5GHB3_AMBAR|nr:hypothetical protein M8C21_029588 [Ambrosia artemisiifolia]
MGGSFRSYLLFLLFPILLILHETVIHNHRHHQSNAVADDDLTPALSTNSRWIVDDRVGGERVKLSCVNWVSHLDTAVAEGLSRQPLDVISKKIVEMGFNCVRLTYPLFLFTDDKLGSMTMRESFMKLGLSGSIAGVQVNNPSLVDLPLVDVFQEVVSNLDENNVMIILDNHLSKPGWCCNDNDGNGFFGDLYFDPEVWIEGLSRVASMFKGYNNVIDSSGRVLLLSYEPDGDDWITGNANEVCGRVIDRITNNALFLLDQGYPLFMSEWGVDQRGTNDNDNRYLNCLLGWAAENDLDWALWALVGSYYYREGVIGMEETYGLLNWNWRELRNSSFLEKISPLQSPFQAPGSNALGHKIIFHPSTGLCMQSHSLSLGPCSNALGLDYTPEKILRVKGTNYCLEASEVHTPVQVGIICGDDSSTKWEAISASKMHLSSKDKNGNNVCLDIDSKNNIVTNDCECLSKDNSCDPSSQWFKVIDSTSFNIAPSPISISQHPILDGSITSI